MRTIWTPPTETRLPDITNPFDMTAVFQDRLTALNTTEERDRYAAEALELITEAHTPAHREVTVITDMALFDSTESPDSAIITPDIGLIGELQGISYIRMGSWLCSLALHIDAMQVFKPSEPGDSDIAMMVARTPIAAVQIIETA